MRFRIPPPIAFMAGTVLLAALVFSGHVLAAEKPSCGRTAQEAIAAAEKALAASRGNAHAAALTCLVQAVKRLESMQPIKIYGSGDQPVLQAPVVSGKTGKR